MATLSRYPVKAIITGVMLALGAGLLPAPAAAQSDDRVRRLEAEVRALQRQVFPGGSDRYFEPEITPSQDAQPTPQVGMPAESALTDVLARLGAIESQLARLTAASEINANALEQLERRVDEAEAARAAAPAPAGMVPPPDVAGQESELAQSSPAPSSGASAPAASGEVPQNASQAGGPTPERVAAVQAITKPATDDAGDDEYTYGFRLWDAGYYPEAQQQLALFLERYPNHSRVTYARNLLGRAFLDAGNARTAANYFLENYQANKQAERAPDSLLYLAESMITLGDTSRACIALSEFGDAYPALATGRLQTQYDANRNRVDCD